MQRTHGLLPAPREPLHAVRNLATRLGQVGAASLIEKPLAALALLPLDVPGEPARVRIPCQGSRGDGVSRCSCSTSRASLQACGYPVGVSGVWGHWQGGPTRYPINISCSNLCGVLLRCCPWVS